MSQKYEISGWTAQGNILVKDFADVVCEPSDLSIYGRKVDTDIFHDDELCDGHGHIIDTLLPEVIAGLKVAPDDYRMELKARIKNPNSTLVYLPKAMFEDSMRLVAIDHMLTMAFQNDPRAVQDLAQIKVIQQPTIMCRLRAHHDDDGAEKRSIPVSTRLKRKFDASRFYLMTNFGGTFIHTQHAPNGRSFRCGPGDVAAFSGDTVHSAYPTGLPEGGRVCFRLGFRSDEINWDDALDRQSLLKGTAEGIATIISTDEIKRPWHPDLIPAPPT